MAHLKTRGNMIKFIKNYIFYIRYKRAVKNANKIKELTGKTTLVIIWKGKPVTVTKQALKDWIRDRRLKKGVTVAQIEKGALYIAHV